MKKEDKKHEQLTYLGVLGIVLGFCGILFSLLPFIGFSFDMNLILSIIFSIIFFLIGVLLLIASIGFLGLKEWARKTYSYSIISIIIFTPIYLISFVYYLTISQVEGMAGIILFPIGIFAIIFVIYLISIIRYLNKPEIKEYFVN